VEHPKHNNQIEKDVLRMRIIQGVMKTSNVPCQLRRDDVAGLF
jgi:hypothetical protein